MSKPLPLSSSAALSLPLLLSLAPPRAQDPLGEALARMRAQELPGLCFVLPRDHAELGGALDGEALAALRADFAERVQALGIHRGNSGQAIREATPVGTAEEQFTTLLHRLLLTRDPRAQLLLLEAVLVVATRDGVGARAGENLVLLGARGQRLAGTWVDLRDDASFVRGADALLQVTRPTLVSLPAEARQARAELLDLAEAAESEARGRALRAVMQDRSLLPALQQALARATSPEQRARLGVTASDLTGALAGRDRAGLLPFGVAWKDELGDVDPCPACGMMMVSASARRMLQLAAR